MSGRRSMVRRLSVAFAALTLAAIVWIGSAAAAPVSGIGLTHLGGTLSDVSNPSNYSLVLVGQAEAPTAASLPGRSLAYFAGADVNTQWSMGVPYSQAAANGWLLTDSSGNLLVNKGYGFYIGDVGSSGYQQAWITNVLGVPLGPSAASPGSRSTTSSTTSCR